MGRCSRTLRTAKRLLHGMHLDAPANHLTLRPILPAHCYHGLSQYNLPPVVRLPNAVGARPINADPDGDGQRALDECHRHCLRFAHRFPGDNASDDASPAAARAGAGWEPCDVIREAAEWGSAMQ